jgi:hypothetical protein
LYYPLTVEYIDLDFYLWLWWLLTPLVITFLLPMTIGVLFYATSLILYIYKLHRLESLATIKINHASAHQCLSKNKLPCRQRLRAAYERDFWDGARYTVAAIWDAHGWLWHGTTIILNQIEILAKNLMKTFLRHFQDPRSCLHNNQVLFVI